MSDYVDLSEVFFHRLDTLPVVVRRTLAIEKYTRHVLSAAAAMTASMEMVAL